MVYGWIEKVSVLPWGIAAKAKLDSGAKTSSMHAEKIERFEKDGDDWVRFTLEFEDPNDEDELLQFQIERPLERNIRIKQHADEHQRRPVVALELCMGPHVHTIKFSLTDRDKFIYPVLLGRNFLKESALIDPAATFLRGPQCETDDTRKKRDSEKNESVKNESASG